MASKETTPGSGARRGRYRREELGILRKAREKVREARERVREAGRIVLEAAGVRSPSSVRDPRDLVASWRATPDKPAGSEPAAGAAPTGPETADPGDQSTGDPEAATPDAQSIDDPGTDPDAQGGNETGGDENDGSSSEAQGSGGAQNETYAESIQACKKEIRQAEEALEQAKGNYETAQQALNQAEKHGDGSPEYVLAAQDLKKAEEYLDQKRRSLNALRTSLSNLESGVTPATPDKPAGSEPAAGAAPTGPETAGSDAQKTSGPDDESSPGVDPDAQSSGEPETSDPVDPSKPDASPKPAGGSAAPTGPETAGSDAQKTSGPDDESSPGVDPDAQSSGEPETSDPVDPSKPDASPKPAGSSHAEKILAGHRNSVKSLQAELDGLDENDPEHKKKKADLQQQLDKAKERLRTAEKTYGQPAGEPDKKSPEVPDSGNDLEQQVAAARNEYAGLRAEWEQMGRLKRWFGSRGLREKLELAQSKFEGAVARLACHNAGQLQEASGTGDAGKEEAKKPGVWMIQTIALTAIEQRELVDRETQEEYDKRLDERSPFKKVAAKIGWWFAGKENKDGGKLGLGGWLRSGGTGLAAGAALGIFGISVPISSAVGAVSSAGVKLAAHQRALENARGEDRSLTEEYKDSTIKRFLNKKWQATSYSRYGKETTRDFTGEDISQYIAKELLEQAQEDTERRQSNMVRISSKAAMGWGLGFAAGRVAGGLIKSHILDQKPGAADPSNPDAGEGGGQGDAPAGEGGGQGDAPAGEGGGQGDAPAGEITSPSETVSLGSDGWVWDRVVDVLGAEKAMPFLEQLAQTNPDFQLIDLPDGLIGIAYQGNTDPQVVADAISRVAPDLLRQWVLAA